MSNYNPTTRKSFLTGKPFDLRQKYGLLSEALALGGVVVSVSNEWEEQARGGSGAEAPCGEQGARTDARPLSKAHIRPHVEYRAGASLLKSHKGGEQEEQIGGGKRGEIQGFSDDARRRLLYTIGAVRLDAELPKFITLTYPDKFPDPKASKRHLKMFLQRLNRAFPAHGSVWKLEPQQRGAPHYHILTWGVDLLSLAQFVPFAWHEIAGGDDGNHLLWHLGLLGNGNKLCVQQVNSWKGVWNYAAKYLGKTFDVSGWDEKWTGRFWGIANRDNVPFGELIEEEVTEKKAVQVMRYQKRFSGLKRRNNRSLTIFCDADQWVSKLELKSELAKSEHFTSSN